MKTLLINLLIFTPFWVFSQLWKPVGPVPGPNLTAISAIAGYNGEVVVGGSFEFLSGSPFDRVARWTGTEWKDVGGGIKNDFSGIYGSGVSTLINFQNKLFAGGGFAAYPPNLSPILYGTLWDGQAWTPFNGGGNTVSTKLIDSTLYVMGNCFAQSRTSLVGNWENISGNISSCAGLDPFKVITSIERYNNDIYMAGDFYDLNCQTYHIVKKEGNWQPLPTDALAQINFLESYKGYLYAAGGIIPDPNGGIPLGYFFKKWDGTEWHEIIGLQNLVNVTAMIIYGDKLFISAAMSDSLFSSNNINGIFAYDGTKWDTLAVMNGVARAFGVVNDTLYAAGQFSELDGLACSNLLKFTEVSLNTSTSQGINKEIKLYPNPATTEIRVEVPFLYKEIEMRITNTLGIEVKSEKIIHNTPISIADIPEGVYFITITIDNIRYVEKIIKY